MKLAKTFAPPEKRMLRIAPLGAVPDLLRSFGVAPGPLLQQFGLSEAAMFQDPDATMPFAAAGSLLKACAQTTACPHFGLLVGQRGDIASLGAIGLLLRNAPDVKTALNELVTNLDLHDRGATTFLEVSDKRAVLRYEIYEHGVEGMDQISDCAMAIGLNIMRALCAPNWTPTEVRLRHQQPVAIEPYRRCFQTSLKFNAEHTSLVFPTHWLNQPVRLADPALRRHFIAQIQAMRNDSNQSFREQAHKVLVTLIGNQRCSRDQLAEHFSIHPRTLNRRLKEAGTSFRDLHNEARYEMARQLLRDTKRCIPSIAALLGYSDSTAFNRAFSHWEGISPAKWRQHMRSTAGSADAANSDSLVT